MADLVAAGAIRAPSGSRLQRVRAALSFTNISAVYIAVALFVLFALWVPQTFLTASTWHSLFANSSLTALVAIAVTIPLSAGVFNLAVGTEVGMAAILAAWLIEKQHLGLVPALVLTLAAGCAIGAMSGALIVRAKIDSFIATLGMSSILLAMTSWVSGDQQILDLPQSFQNLATNKLLGFTYPVWIMLAVGVVVWYVMQWTPTGRRLYATGGNPNAARLAGVPTSRVIVLRDRRARRAADERPTRGWRPDRRPGLSAAGLCGRVPGLDSVPWRPLQRLGGGHRRLCPRGRRQGPATRGRARLDPRPLQRRRAADRRRHVQVPAHGSPQRGGRANPAAKRGALVTRARPHTERRGMCSAT
jgi:Branched-chain amino acid transport system / permease component